MTDNQFKKKNHFVAQAYLSRWAGTDGRVARYQLLVSHPRVPAWDRRFPSGLARYQHLYTRAITGADSDDIERWLEKEFETPAQEALSKATSDARLTASDYERLARYAAAQDVRTPARLLEILHSAGGSVEKVMTESLERAGELLKVAVNDGVRFTRQDVPLIADARANAAEFPARVRIEPGDTDATTRLHVDTVVGRAFWHWAMRHLLQNMTRHLVAHQWTILRSPAGFTWVTTDDPVVKLNGYGLDGFDFGGGWGSNGTVILLPLGPRHLLYTEIGGRPRPRGTILKSNDAEYLQAAMVQHAWRNVFATELDCAVESIRPRRIDSVAFNREREQWRRWPDEQSIAERGLKGPENPQ